MLLAWALAMLVPDLLRVALPLASYGFLADNDGLIYDVTGAFDEAMVLALADVAGALVVLELAEIGIHPPRTRVEHPDAVVPGA